MRHGINRLAIPLKKAANKLVEIPRSMSEYISIVKENRNLKLQLDAMKIRMVNALNLERELEDLRKATDLRYSVSQCGSIEKVIGFDGAFSRSFLMISATHVESRPGSVVIDSDGLIGVVHDLNRTTARVMLITDSKIFVPVISISGVRIILSGDGKSSMRSVEICSESLSADMKLNPGDVLYTSGEGGVFPVGIPVAVVTEIRLKDCIVFASPVADLSKTSFVRTMNPASKTE
jgi:rod shape-determining protein MreC